MAEEEESSNGTKLDTKLDLSGQGIKKLTKNILQDRSITNLILDENDLQRLENIDHLSEVETLSATHNQLLRIYGIARLTNLTSINLAHNGIVTIEGLKDLSKLRWLSLAGNSIKSLDHLNTNFALEHLDLSENNLAHISDVSYLKNLKVLRLHGNKIHSLHLCERYLPVSLRQLTLAGNQLADLNDMSHLSHLANLEEFSIANNPCVNMTGDSVGFDYRPFIINWCMSLRSIDDYVVDAKESLRAEWLYSQGRGRQFRAGEQAALAEYLSTVCPLSGESLRTEQEQKLMLILSKAQQHQRQLWEETSRTGVERSSSTSAVASTPAESTNVPSPSTINRQRPGSVKRPSPRPTSAREHRRSLSGTDSPLTSSSYTVELPVTLYGTGPRSPRSGSIGGAYRGLSRMDVMAASADAAALCTEEAEVPTVLSAQDMMSRSLDPELLMANGTTPHGDHARPTHLCTTENGDGIEGCSTNPLKAASKLVPVPETIMSPDYRPATARHLPGTGSPEHTSRLVKPQRNTNHVFIARNEKITPKPSGASRGGTSMSASWSPYAEKKLHKGSETGKSSPAMAKSRLLASVDRPWHRDTNSASPTVLKSPRRSAMSRSMSVEPGRRGSVHRAVSGQLLDKKNTPSPTRRRCATTRFAHENDDSSDDSEMSVSKLETIRILAVERKQRSELRSETTAATQHNTNNCTTTKADNGVATAAAALLIQRMWRGYHTRNLCRRGAGARQEIRTTRVEDHVRHLTKELQATKAALETERKLRLLQMEAIKALWREVQTLQPKSPRTPQAVMGMIVNGGSNRDSGVDMSPLPSAVILQPQVTGSAGGEAVLELSRTCSVLQGQVQQLQDSLESVVRCMSSFCQLSAATQTVEPANELLAKGDARQVRQACPVVPIPQAQTEPESQENNTENVENIPSCEIRHETSQTDLTAVVTAAATPSPPQQPPGISCQSLLAIPRRRTNGLATASSNNGAAKSRPSFLPIFHTAKGQHQKAVTKFACHDGQLVPEQVHMYAKSLVESLVKTAMEKAEIALIERENLSSQFDLLNDRTINKVEVLLNNKTG